MPATLKASTIRPSLTVNSLEKSLRFYTEGLGFEIERTVERDGQVRFYMLRAGNATLGLGQDDFAKGKDRVKGVAMRIYIVTGEDLHVVANRIKAAGIKLDSDPAPMASGPLGFSLTDPDGFMITIRAEN